MAYTTTIFIGVGNGEANRHVLDLKHAGVLRGELGGRIAARR